MSDRLIPILETKRAHIEARRNRHTLEELRSRAEALPPPRGFRQALIKKLQRENYTLIAEIKKASPSKGLIRPEFDPGALAHAYKLGGATCLSVLTDEPYFQGRDHDLIAARGAVDLPILRKDFIIDAYQIYESRCLGADCILLIVAALSDQQLGDFLALAAALSLDVLVEVHDKPELERALRFQPPLLGINNRNLKTLEINIQTSIELAALLPSSVHIVSESGLATPQDLALMKQNGIATFLIGESLLRHIDVTAATKTLLG